ncbi:MAG: pyridoxamine 5'-phosphate oxidase family protein [Bacillota bacterium]
MSKSLGAQLNEDLLQKLEGGRLFREGGLGLAVLTVDETGWPHVALAPGAVAVRPERLVVALGGASRSLRYAEREGKVTLLVAGPDTLYYVKGQVQVLRRQMNVIPQEAAMLVRITEVLSDMESFVTITGGISYRYGVMHEDYIKVIGALLDELETLAEEN